MSLAQWSYFEDLHTNGKRRHNSFDFQNSPWHATGVLETSKRTSRKSIDTWREALWDTWRGKRGGDTRTKINRKRKENIRCQGWISFAQRRVRLKLIYMWRGRCNDGVQRHFLCRNITQRQINIYTLHRKFIYSFPEHWIPALYQKNPAYDGIFLESCGAQNGEKINSVRCNSVYMASKAVQRLWQSPASHRGSLFLNPGQSTWSLCWTKFLRDISLPVLLLSPVSIIPPTLHFHSFVCHRTLHNLSKWRRR